MCTDGHHCLQPVHAVRQAVNSRRSDPRQRRPADQVCYVDTAERSSGAGWLIVDVDCQRRRLECSSCQSNAWQMHIAGGGELTEENNKGSKYQCASRPLQCRSATHTQTPLYWPWLLASGINEHNGALKSLPMLTLHYRCRALLAVRGDAASSRTWHLSWRSQAWLVRRYDTACHSWEHR